MFFLSGASALIFESLWFHLAGLTLGNSIWATSLVLSSFMGGLALGNGLTAFWGRRITSPIRFYAFLEIAIAVVGVALVLIFPMLTRFFVPLWHNILDQTLVINVLDKTLVINVLRTTIAFLLMLIPATAMGATLPILVTALYRKDSHFGRVLGLLYGWNTFGAVVGVIVNELLLTKWFGLTGAAYVAASFNILAAVMAVRLSRRVNVTDYISQKQPVVYCSSLKSMRLLFASFSSGFVLLSLEVIWFRFLMLFCGAYSWNYVLMLSMVLLGISLGGFSGSKWFSLHERAQTFLMPVVAINGLLIIVLYNTLDLILPSLWRFDDSVRLIVVSGFLMLPVSITSGIIFTMLGKALHDEVADETKAAGLLTLANTAGGMVGSVVAALIFIPLIGIETSFLLLAIVYGVIGLLIFDRALFVQPLWTQALHFIAVVGFLLSVFLFPFGSMQQFLDIPVRRFAKAGESGVFCREGVTETIQYLRADLLGEPYYHRLITNDYPMSATTSTAKRYMKMYVYWPVAVHPQIKNALLICFGCGSTAKAITDTKGVEHLDIVDISQGVIESSKIIYSPEENPIHDPRVDVHIEDGRFFLLTTKRSFDLITGEPPPPNIRGVQNLYSREYFQLMHERLAPGGIVTYWLPVSQLSLSQTKAILQAFCDVFQESSLWIGAGFNWMMVGMKTLPDQPVATEDFERQWDDPTIGPELNATGLESPEQFGSLFIADGQRLRAWIADNPALVDNYPHRLSYRARDRRHDLRVYHSLMDSDASLKNFMNSQSIARIWPETMREKALQHFGTRQIINELLMTHPERSKHIVELFHNCVHQPALSNYILWLFGSDQYAQRIIAKVPLEKLPHNRPVLSYLTAASIQAKDYRLAEHYMDLWVQNVRPGAAETNMLYLCKIYLLYRAQDMQRAIEVSKEFIGLSGDAAKREQYIMRWWKWFETVLN